MIIRNAIALLAITVLTACGPGSSFDSGTDNKKSDAVSRLSTQGNDLRIYEFTPTTSPGTQCVFVAGSQKGGLDCFPKVPYSE